MSNIFQNGLDLYILMGTYSNPEYAINGELCKGLTLPPYFSEGLPSGLAVVKYFGEIEEVKRIIIGGPKERIEKTILEHQDKLPKKEIIVRNESKPGNLSLALKDMVKNILDPSLQISPWILGLATDYTNLNPDITNIIFNDFRKSVYLDYIHNSKTELYLGVGNEIEDNLAYARIRNTEIDRKGLIIGPSKSLRFANSFLARSDLVKYKRDRLGEIINHTDKRKIKKDISEAISYWIHQLFTKGDEHPLKKGLVASKAIANYTRKHLLKDFAPYPYFTISENDCNSIVSDVLGIPFKFVETIGAADFDDDIEYELARTQNRLPS